MNSKPLPKPTPTPPTTPTTSPSTPPTGTTQQNVVFDTSKKEDTAASRIPLAQKPTLPPTSVSALSSMSSNKIPSANTALPINEQKAPPIQMPQTTVLGRPIPQAMRGEATPAGLAGQNPGMLPSQPVVKSPVPTATNQVSSSSPTTIKQEDPSLTEDQNKKNQPKFATAKSPVMKFLPFIAGGIVVLLLIVFGLSRFMGGSKTTSVANNTATTNPDASPTTGAQGQRTEVPAQKTTLEYWGLWEPNEVMEEVIKEFEEKNPGVSINYTKQSPVDYRERLQTAIQTGNGPDLFRFHASWVPMLKSTLSPIPSAVASAGEFQSNYYPVVTEQLVSAGQYVGLPLMYDGLVLYYNEDILDTAGEVPPKTWPELRALAVKLTVPSATGIQRGGLAIGNATNVEHFSDILAVLILQNGGALSDVSAVETRDALSFYTNFQIKDKVWDMTLPSSTVAFARGDVAMMFAPSWRAHEIKALNPELKFATAPLPQLSEDEPITWGSYWAEGISSVSKNKDLAAQFLTYLNADATLKKFYSSASKVRAFGEIYPKASMSKELAEDPIVGPVLEDAVYSQSWYLNSFTHDNGINDQMIGYYKTAVDSIVGGDDVEEAQELLSEGVNQVLKQYSINTK